LKDEFELQISQRGLIQALIACSERQAELLNNEDPGSLDTIEMLKNLEKGRSIIVRKISWNKITSNIASDEELTKIKTLNDSNEKLLKDLLKAAEQKIVLLKNRRNIAKAYSSNS